MDSFAPRILVITNGNQGSDAQAEGLIQALGAKNVELKHVRLGGLYGWLAPSGPAPLGHVGRRGKVCHPPWPDMVISVGRHAAPYALALRKAARGQTFAVALQDPRTKKERWDLIWAPAHDGLEAPNVVTTLTSPHRMTRERLAAAAATMRCEIAGMPRPWIAVLVGGPNKAFRFGARQARKLCAQLQTLAPGGSFLITTSRRTPQPVADTIREWMGGRAARLWIGGAGNPIMGFLGLADGIVVTADSVNMAGEAASTGKPVFVFDLPGRAKKFRRFHKELAETGATRPLDGAAFQSWSYEPVDANKEIAAEIKRAYSAWAQSRPGA